MLSSYYKALCCNRKCIFNFASLLIADYARDVVALLDELKIDKANILGNHTGAYIAAEVAVAYQERVTKIILSNIDKFSLQQSEAVLNKYTELHRFKSDNSQLIERLSARSSYADLELNHRCFLEEMKCYGYPAYGALAVKNYCDSLPERLSLIKCPTLILSGSENIKGLVKMGFSTPENRTSIAEIIPQAKFVEIEGGTFLIMNQMAEKISDFVINFIEEAGN